MDDKERDKIYRKTYYEKNKEKVSQCVKEYRSKNPEKWKGYSKKYRIKHKEEIREKQMIYYNKNKEKYMAESKIWHQKNRKKTNEHKKKWRDNNKVQVKEYGIKYRNFIKKKALDILGGSFCVKCKTLDLRVLTINHKNLDGCKEKEKTKICTNIINGKRNTSDLEVRCYNCNILYEYEMGRRIFLEFR